jgi:hypothetical protein
VRRSCYRYARVERIPGGELEDSYVLDGVMFNKDIVHPKVLQLHIHIAGFHASTVPLQTLLLPSHTVLRTALVPHSHSANSRPVNHKAVRYSPFLTVHLYTDEAQDREPAHPPPRHWP